jgi:GH18 family chitinase
MKFVLVVGLLTLFSGFVYCAPCHEGSVCTQPSCSPGLNSKGRSHLKIHPSYSAKVVSAHLPKSSRTSSKAARPTVKAAKSSKTVDKKGRTTATSIHAKRNTQLKASSSMTTTHSSSAATSASANTPATPLPKSSWPNHKVLGYYTLSSTLPTNSIPWSLLTHIILAFAQLDSTNTVSIPSKFSTMAQQVFSSAIANGVKPVLSIGGYSGSAHFSKMVSTSSSRSTFITSVTSLVQKYNLSGIDIDWEYPGRSSSTKIPYDPVNDVPNLLLLFNELRSKVGTEVSLSAAVSSTIPWQSDMSSFADVVDWFGCMEYNFATKGGSTTGAAAPLLGNRSASTGIQNWISSGLAPDKIVFGLPGYGRSWTLADVPSLLPFLPIFVKC